MIPGFRVGHHTADGPGWLTGTTVVVAEDGAVGGVDVRGGGPGTRETDLLDPVATLDRVNAVVLTGGSAYGLAAADGVLAALERDGQGLPVGPEPGQVVPIVPAAVLFDLGRGGSFSARPGPDFGASAYAAAGATWPGSGCVGAGTGATCGGLKGGIGYAEVQVASGVRVAAVVAVNAAGSAVDPLTGRLWADRRHRLPDPTPTERADLVAVTGSDGIASGPRSGGPAALNTTIGVVLADAALTKAQATKVAAVAHDGLARAVRPAHSLLDGDTVFCLARGDRHLSPGSDHPADPRAAVAALNELLAASADIFTDACLDALVAARRRAEWPAYLDLVPSIG